LDPGDIRLVVTKINGKPTAVLYRQIDPNASEREKTRFESPIGKLIMDSVKDISSQLEFAEDNGNYEFSIPLDTLTPISLANLGIQPHHRGRWLIGDLGILRGNNRQTIQRIYWNNLDTAAVSDIPTEAQLKPLNWGLFRLFEFSQPDIEPIEKPANAKSGLSYSYYESPDNMKDDATLRQFFRSLDWLKQIPIAKGVVSIPSTEPKKRKDWFGLSFSGYLDIPKDGLYQFFIYGNNYARFTLGGVILREIIEGSDGVLIHLKAGTYPVGIDYCQHYWEDILDIRWGSSEIPLQTIPEKCWSYNTF
ncbi:hypothetical protein FJZ33_03880, partial [Candidatus Poribacteria bacterium]|nr:hypothetical protein [Candidatus Poribacteria bacterium]